MVMTMTGLQSVARDTEESVSPASSTNAGCVEPQEEPHTCICLTTLILYIDHYRMSD